MSKRIEALSEQGLEAIFRHHPYLSILQKEDWRDYLLLLAQIYDLLEEGGKRVPIELVRSVAIKFYSVKGLSFVDQKVTQFLLMLIGELQVLKDSHDQFGQRFVETTRSGKALLQLIENLVSQRSRFTGTGAETLLGALNDILISRRQMSAEEAIRHHKEKIEAYKEDLVRIKTEGLAAAQLLPIAHSNEALFSQAEEASIHILHSIEDVKGAIERQRSELANGYFETQRSAGETLGAIADFYDKLYTSPEYASYVQAKDLLSHIEGYQARFSLRNVDRLVQMIETRDLLPADFVRRSSLKSFMHQFTVADSSIQDKIKEQLRILQQQVLYSITTDVEGLRSTLQALISDLLGRPQSVFGLFEGNGVSFSYREDCEPGPIEIFDFEIPVEVPSQDVSEEAFDRAQEQELFLALMRADEGTLKDIIARLGQHLDENGELAARTYRFPRGLAEYYVLSEISLFSDAIERIDDGSADLWVESKFGAYVLRNAPSFILQRKKELSTNG